MTSSITPITAASNSDGTTTSGEREHRLHGVTALRGIEARALISLGMDALGEAHTVGHDMHHAIYDKNASISDADLQDRLGEVLTCMEAAEHYLLMLGSVFEERPRHNHAGDTASSPVH
jgi:hypothetical protein